MASAVATCVQSLDGADLAAVLGGSSTDFGRCGPGSAWPWLGNVYTPECAAHDAAVRGAEAKGTPGWLAHVEALPKLPAAVWSYARAKITGH